MVGVAVGGFLHGGRVELHRNCARGAWVNGGQEFVVQIHSRRQRLIKEGMVKIVE